MVAERIHVVYHHLASAPNPFSIVHSYRYLHRYLLYIRVARGMAGLVLGWYK